MQRLLAEGGRDAYYKGPIAERITDFPVEIVDGHVLIPDRPGLGLDLDETEMAKYPYDESHFLDMFGKGGWEKRNLDL